MRRWPLRNSKWQFASDGVSVVVVVDFRQENDEKYFQMSKKKKKQRQQKCQPKRKMENDTQSRMCEQYSV